MSASILKKFFEPKSVALVGATRTPGFGFGIPFFWKKHGWLEKAYLVNPKAGEIEGKKVLSSVSELPEGIDLAIVLVPAAIVKQTLIELGKKKIRAAVIESAGFAETGDPGRAMQEELAEVAKSLGMRLLGPNCVGVVNCENKFATIEVMDRALAPGNAAIVAQSGVFGNILLDHLPEAGLKISKVATLGNKIDLDETDFLEYFCEDPATRVIMVYQEGTRDGAKFLSALKKTTAKKPVIILKSGRTPLGSRATLSHTGSLSGQDEIYDGAFKQGGAVRAQSIQELIDLAKVLSSQPKIKGKKVGVVTTTGSVGAMASDALYRNGLELADWSVETVQKIKSIAPGYLNVKNPLDLGPSGVFAAALEIAFGDPNPDAFILIPVIPFAAIDNFRKFGFGVKEFFGDLQKMRAKAQGKPVVVILIGYREWLEEVKQLCDDNIAFVESVDNAAKALSSLLLVS
jgi:acetate---CoA ligase (ADP-forming)